MIPYQELEYKGWPLVQKDPSLESALAGAIAAGRMLHEKFYNGSEDPVVYVSRSETLVAQTLSSENPIIGKTISQDADHGQGLVWLVNGIDGFSNFAQKRPFCDVMITQVENGHLIRGVVYDFINGELYYAARGEGSYLNGQQLIIPNSEMSKSTVISYAPLVDRENPEDKMLVHALWRGMERIAKKYRQFQREFQAGGIELCWVAAGRLGGYASSWSSRVNLGGGVLEILEAGGTATNIDGSEWIPGNRGVVAGAPEIYNSMLEVFQRYTRKQIY